MLQDDKTGLNYFLAPEVYLIAKTEPTPELVRSMQDYELELPGREDLDTSNFIPELAGRYCYYAFGKSSFTPDNKTYIKNIIDHKHFSVLEHLNYTFLFRGISRGFTHEMVRHRHGSFSQFSTRYCKSKDMAFVIPNYTQSSEKRIQTYLDHCKDSLDRYKVEFFACKEQLAQEMPDLNGRDLGKKARGCARSYLPIGMEAPIIITGNLRMWREVVEKRISPYAEKEINDTIGLVFNKIREHIPHGIDDLKDLEHDKY